MGERHPEVPLAYPQTEHFFAKRSEAISTGQQRSKAKKGAPKE